MPEQYQSYGWEWDRFVAYWHHLGASHLSFGVTVWWPGPNVEVHLPGGFLRVGVPSRWRMYGMGADVMPVKTRSPFSSLTSAQ